MGREELETVKAYFGEAVVGDAAKLDTYVSENYVTNCKWEDRDGLRKVLAEFQAAYPELTYELTEAISEGEKVAVHVKIDCIRPNDRRTIESTAILKVTDGQIVQEWSNSDSFF